MKVYVYNSAVFQLFTTFNTSNLKTKIYLLFSVGFYLFGIYQNVYSCISFFNNMNSINKYIIDTRNYIQNTISHMDNFIKHSSHLKSYKPFIDELMINKNILQEFNHKIIKISNYKWDYDNISSMGYNMVQFHDIFYDKNYTHL